MLRHTSAWFKHILLVNTKGLGVAKLRRKPSPILQRDVYYTY